MRITPLVDTVWQACPWHAAPRLFEVLQNDVETGMGDFGLNKADLDDSKGSRGGGLPGNSTSIVYLNSDKSSTQWHSQHALSGIHTNHWYWHYVYRLQTSHVLVLTID